MRLQTKIVLALAVLLMFSATASILYVKLRFSPQLRGELEKRGISIARNLAHHTTGSVLARDRLALKMEAVAQVKNETDIAYIVFLGPRGKTVLAHTFGETFPEALLAANPLPEGVEYSIRHLQTEDDTIYDVAMPVADGGLGLVRVGLSLAPIEQAVNQLNGGIVLVTLFIGGAALLLSWPLAASITRPIARLTETAEAVAAGDFEHQVPVTGEDEVGHLGTVFNRMLDQVRVARNELLQRNVELATEVVRRSAAESELERQLSLTTALMDEIPTPVFYKDIHGVYQGCNRAFEVFVGLSRHELCGRTVAEVFPAEEVSVHSNIDCDLFAHPGSRHYELSFTNRHGQRREVIFQKATYNTPSGEVAGMVGILMDVTHEREIDRMRSDFVSTTAHEFQTPLTAIIGFCEVLLSLEDIPPATQREYLGIIHERGEFLSQLVNRFLDVSRIESGRPIPLDTQPCHPDPLLRRLLKNYLSKAGGHRIELHLDPHSPLILIDEVRFAQVIENLLSNALKYSPAGSLIRIGGETRGASYVITVSDEGPGMTAEQRGRIFDKFYRIDSSNQAPSGTGLGLYISRAIVIAHGGTLEVDAAPGGGSCFTVTVPLAA